MARTIKSLFFAFCLLLTGCSKNTLELYTEFLGIEQYASYYIGTPDPALCNPDYGQMLVVKWDLPKEYLCYGGLHISVRIRYQCGTEETLDIPVTTKSGASTWRVMNDDFYLTGGIVTYKAVLMSDCTPLCQWKHALWNETITIGDTQEK